MHQTTHISRIVLAITLSICKALKIKALQKVIKRQKYFDIVFVLAIPDKVRLKRFS